MMSAAAGIENLTLTVTHEIHVHAPSGVSFSGPICSSSAANVVSSGSNNNICPEWSTSVVR